MTLWRYIIFKDLFISKYFSNIQL